MIKTEYYGENGLGSKLYRTYSDEKKYIKQLETNTIYSEAIDVADENDNISYTYEETNINLEENTKESEV